MIAINVARSVVSSVAISVTGASQSLAYQALLGLFASGEAGLLVPSINDARADGKLWQDAAGTTPAVAADDPVGRIDDYSGNGINLTQSSAGLRPLLKQDGNSNWYLLSDGTDDYLQATFAGSATDWSLVFAMKKSAGISAFALDVSGSSAGGITQVSNDLRLIAGNGVTDSYAVLDHENLHLQACYLDYSLKTMDYFRDTTLQDTLDVSAGADFGSFDTLSIMSLPSGGNRSVCSYYGILAIARNLSDVERTAVAEYMASQSGVTL